MSISISSSSISSAAVSGAAINVYLLNAAQGTYSITGGTGTRLNSRRNFGAAQGTYSVIGGTGTKTIMQRLLVAIAPILSLMRLRKSQISLKDLRTDKPVLQLIRKNPPTLN